MSGNRNGARTARDAVVNSRGLLKVSFLQSTSEILKELIANDERELNKLKQELALIENGKLYIHKRGKEYSFGCRLIGAEKEIGITKDVDRINSLARRVYVNERIGIIEARTRKMRKITGSWEDGRNEKRLIDYLRKYEEAGLDLAQILFTKEQNEWIDSPYTPNPHHPEHLRYSTNGGVYMRSKSETVIGNALEAIGVPYRYDDLVIITDGYRGKSYKQEGSDPFRESYFADFKVPNLLRGITIHEHLGAFQIDSYGDGSLKRLNDYHNFNVTELPEQPVKHDEFTWSFENDIRDAKAMQKLIAKMIMPGLV